MTRSDAELAELDAVAQAGLVRRGEVSPRELVEAAVRRIERLDPAINAVIHRRFERALEEASEPPSDAPFRGVPVLLKDLGAYQAGEPHHGGMRFLKRLGYRAGHDSYQTLRLRRAGFIVLGRTNTPELGLMATTESLAYGPCRNPWNLERSTGGSSGGSAAAVASGMVPVAHATDGGGSIRIPASECGLVGLKPSRGRISMGPESAEGPAGLTTALVVSRTVRDTAALLDVMHGWMPGDPYAAPSPARPYVAELGREPGRLRIGFTHRAPEGFPACHPDCVEAVKIAARRLEELGHDVVETFPQALDQPGVLHDFRRFWTVLAAAGVDQFEAMTGQSPGPDDLEPLTRALAEPGREMTALEFLGFRGRFNAFTRHLADWWGPRPGYDLLLTPTIAQPPPRIGQFHLHGPNSVAEYTRLRNLVLFTQQFNVTGQPAISLPGHWSPTGLPIGVQLAAAYGREDLLLEVAAQFERAWPWAHRWPEVSAVGLPPDPAGTGRVSEARAHDA